MKIKGVEEAVLRKIADEMGFRMDNVRRTGNYVLFVLRMNSPAPTRCGNMSAHANGLVCTRPRDHEGKHWHRDDQRKIHATWTLGEDDPNVRYRKKGYGRMAFGTGAKYGNGAVCYHGHRDFMRKVFEHNRDAVIGTKMAAYRGEEDFEAKHQVIAYRNMGSQMYPISYGEACDCNA